MGGFIQKTLSRGRGKEKGYLRLLIPAIAGALLSAQFFLLFFGLREKLIYLYAAVSLLTAIVLAYGYLKDLISGPLTAVVYVQCLLEASLQIWHIKGLHLIHYPVIAGGSFILHNWQFWLFMALQPILHLKELINGGSEIVIFTATLVVIGPCIYLATFNLKKNEEKYRQAYQNLIQRADTAVGSYVLDRDAIVKRYLAETDNLKKDLTEIAKTLSYALLADRTTIFIFEGGRPVPLATDEEPLPEMKHSGLLYEVIEQKRPRLVLFEDHSQSVKAGFECLEGVMSLLYCPVMDDNVLVGIMVSESLRYRAFEEHEVRLSKAMSIQVSQLIKKHRLLSIMSIEHELLQVLQKESEKLIQKLEIQDVTETIRQGAMAISGAEQVFVMLRDGRSYVLINADNVEKNRFTLKGTLLEDIAINKQPFYFRDVRHFKKHPLPFKAEEVLSLAGFPLLSGNNITGMVVVTSPEPEAFTERHLGIMQLYFNQASESISRALLHEDIKMKALTDGLTGLFNHRHFQERLEENIKRATRLREKLSLMLLDIDHFKRINDTYGHPVGDQVLKTLASTIYDTVREIDIPARYGGEEFAVLLLGADKKSAQQIAERLRERVKKLKFNSSSGEFSITISIGIATFPEDANTRESLIERADEALYQAKNSGRDRVVLA